MSTLTSSTAVQLSLGNSCRSFFGAVGTVRKDRRGIPESVRSTVLQRSSVVSARDDSVLCLKWKDKRDVMLLSTYMYHDDRMTMKSKRWWCGGH